jgi:predicted heme/steroid binding protein
MMDQPKTSPAGDGEHSATNDSGADLARALRTMEQKIAEEQRR